MGVLQLGGKVVKTKRKGEKEEKEGEGKGKGETGVGGEERRRPHFGNF